MASSSATICEARPYDVFLSFRGEDTRNGFISHLHKALCMNQISIFIDNDLSRGANISPSLLTAIEESMISVIIFSENYADSKWCLKELAKILQCRELNCQIVIPVFYGVDPSHVRKQIGKFGVAFDKLKERLWEGEMDLNEVRSHLMEAANMSGWNSQIMRPESELIDSIVRDISNLTLSCNKPNSTMTLWENMEDMNVLKYLQNNNEKNWVCQLCGHPFPWDVLPETFCHHLIMICESASEDVREAADWRFEAERSRDGGSRSPGSSVESNYVAQGGNKRKYDQGEEVSSVRRNWQNKWKARNPLDSLSPT